MVALTEKELADYEGQHISKICGNGFHKDADNHCAHFVSHALGFGFGFTCKGMTGKGEGGGASVKVHELFAKCPDVGLWKDKPSSVTTCLAFVTRKGNVKLDSKEMANVPSKHVGIYCNGNIWHYSNTGEMVKKVPPDQFAKHYPGNDIAVFYGTFPA